MEEKGKKEVGNVLMTDYYPLNFIRIFFCKPTERTEDLFMVHGVGGLSKKRNWAVGRRKYLVSFRSCYSYNGGMTVLYNTLRRGHIQYNYLHISEQAHCLITASYCILACQTHKQTTPDRFLPACLTA